MAVSNTIPMRRAATPAEAPDAGPPLKIFLAGISPFLGGAEVAAERLAVGLREHGHDVFVAMGSTGIALDRMRDLGIPCVHAAMPFTDKWKLLSYTMARAYIRRLIKRQAPDIIHSNDLPTSQIVSNAAKNLGIPRICHHRWIFPGNGIDWLNKFGAERHLFVSKGLMDELYGNSPKLAASSGAVVYDGLPMPVMPTEESRCLVRSQLGLDPSRALVLFAGQIIERKGVADLLHAWVQLQPKYAKRADLVIVGDDIAGHGEYRVAMEKLAKELNANVDFQGFQKNVPDWLTACDIAVVPSHAEPLGNATLEAMALCRPVIGGNVGGIPEMVIHEETGLLIPPKSPSDLAAAIDRLLSNPEEAKRFGQAARVRCENLFSLDAHIESVVREYRQLIAAK